MTVQNHCDPEKDREISVDPDETRLPPTQAWTKDGMRRGLAGAADPNRNGASHCICPMEDKLGGDTAILKAADMRVLEILKLPRKKRSDSDRKLINRHEREQFATNFPFVSSIVRFDLRIRHWGVALDDKGVPANAGEPIPLEASNGTVPGKVWVIELKEEHHSRQTLPEGGTLVTCRWEIIQKAGSGSPRWLFFSIRKSHNLSFHSSELRTNMSTRREFVLVDLMKAAEACDALKARLPITITTPYGCSRCNKGRYQLGEYLLRVTQESLDEETTGWTIVLQTVAKT